VTHFENQSIATRLRGIATMATLASLVVIVILTLGFGVLFVVKDRQRRASEILLLLEKSSRNMNDVNGTMQSYLLTPEENGVWDEKDSYETSAESFLTLAHETARDKEMIGDLQSLLSMISDRLSPMEDEFEKLIKKNTATAKEYYLEKYLPELRVFDGKINLARSKATEVSTQSTRAINFTMYLIAGLVFALLIANGLFMIRKSKQIAESASHLLEDVCSGLVKNAKSVQLASRQVENSSANLAQAAGEQASSQQETSSSIEEILRILTRNSQHAAANLQICQKGQQETVAGKKAVEALRAAMVDFQTLNSRLENLIKIIGDVDAKTNIINDIAFQTRILSFNASVEAARSGEHGKGFAVVAEEVGKLSALSKDAAEEIKLLISSSGQEVTEAVRLTQEKISNTRDISIRVTGLFDSFYRVMGEIMSATEQMMTAAMEQQTGMEQIRTTMVEVSNSTEITSENSEKLLTYARGLASESEAMRKSVNQLSQLIVENAESGGELVYLRAQDSTPDRASSAN
jgi:methyl-accepting chemotaxis protein